MSSPPYSPTGQEIQTMVQSIEQLRLCSYATASMVALMTYDIIINLKREIPLVWYRRERNDPSNLRHHFPPRVKQALLRFLFIFARYYGLLYLTIMFMVNNTAGLSVTVCKAYFYYANLAGTVVYVAIVNALLAMRISALNEGNRPCTIVLVCLVVGEFLMDYSMSVVMAVRTADEVVSPPPWSPQPGCLITSCATPALVLASWVMALAVCTIFCVMTLKNIIWDRRNERVSLEEMLRLTPRTRVLLFDAVMVYFLTFAIILVSTVVLTVVNNELSALVVPVLITTYSYCASRLILNIRAVDDELCPADVPADPDSLPPLPLLVLPKNEEQPMASTSCV